MWHVWGIKLNLKNYDSDLEWCFSSLISCHASYNAVIESTDIGDHKCMVTRLVHQYLVSGVVRHLSAVDEPGDLWVGSAGHTTVESRHLPFSYVSIVAYTDKIWSQHFCAVHCFRGFYVCHFLCGFSENYTFDWIQSNIYAISNT